LLAGLVDGVEGVVGIYWGSAGATHEPNFFRSVALDPDSVWAMLWSGVSIHDDGKRVSLASLGMTQLGLPELELTAPREQGNDASSFFFDLLSMVAQSGQPIPEGETVGRSERERLPVRYQPSSVDPESVVWRVDLPESGLMARMWRRFTSP
jgi:hypothetical protein